ncbi:MAG: TolC family protein, partial [Aeoliella sp.]
LTQREGLLSNVLATQPLFTGGRIRSDIDAAGADVSAAVSNQQTTELDVLLNVATVYTNVLLAQRVVEVSERQLQSLAKHAQDVKNRVDQGVGIRNDLLAAEVAQADAHQKNLQAIAILDVAIAAYNRALQRPLDMDVTLDDLGEPTEYFDLESLTQRALAGRPEIAELNASIRGLRSRACVVRAGNKPQFALQGGFESIENRFLQNEAYAKVAVVGEWNLFDAGRKRHTAVKLEQNAEALLRQRNDIETRIALQVRDAWRQLETTKERVQVNREAIESAEENLLVAGNRYNQGVGTNTEVLDAETLRTATYTNYYSSVYAAVQYLMELSRAVGDFSLAHMGSGMEASDSPAESPKLPEEPS